MSGIEIAILVFVALPYGIALLDQFMCKYFSKNFDERLILLNKIEKQVNDIQDRFMKMEFEQKRLPQPQTAHLPF